MDELLEQFKDHIHEDGEGDTSLSFYLRNARRYVKKATGTEQEYLVLMVAGIMYEYRVAEDELKKALDALTPFMILEVYDDAETPIQ
ncbi:Phage protein [Lysinibacillus capsici]|uniref:Phage protein n=1 Tax=Lysinibacillus capsici TaxID=2115968 RepID=A0A2X0Y8J0_9BACI|nr:phage head-tail connector protein [Lysinibacillus capsici]SPT98790.1 Phage protein [Lysinibacillus capsici]